MNTFFIEEWHKYHQMWDTFNFYRKGDGNVLFSPPRHSSCKPSRWKAFSLEIDLFNHQFKRKHLRGNRLFNICKFDFKVDHSNIISNNILQQRVGIDPENLQIKSKLFFFSCLFFLAILEYQGKGPKRCLFFYFFLYLFGFIPFLGVSPEKIGA